jgi:hypothetical protein
MNERIRELAEQAGFNPYNYEGANAALFKKFAELIVRECAHNISPSGHSEGLSLRDYFAAKSLPIAWDSWQEGHELELESPRITERLARHAYILADAMLKARETP